MAIYKVKIERLVIPSKWGHKVNAQVWFSLDDGKTFCYSGGERYYETLKEALIFKARVEEVAK